MTTSENFRNPKPFPWNAPRELAAQLLAEDELTDLDIAAKVGVSDRQLRNWKAHPDFTARVQELAREVTASALRQAIAKRHRRVKALNDRWQRMQRVIDERAGSPDMQAVPGGKTGLLVRTLKSLGSGPSARVVEEFTVDTGLLKELRDTEKQAAQELGQWVDKLAPTNPDGTDEYDAGGFGDDEVVAILQGLAARLGLAAAGPGRQEPEVAP